MQSESQQSQHKQLTIVFLDYEVWRSKVVLVTQELCILVRILHNTHKVTLRVYASHMTTVIQLPTKQQSCKRQPIIT